MVGVIDWRVLNELGKYSPQLLPKLANINYYSYSLLSNMEKESLIVLNDEHAAAMANTLKVLFNCTCAASPEENSNDEELMTNLSQLCRILHLLLTIEKESRELRAAITR